MWDKLKEQLNILKLEKKKLFLITNSDKFLSLATLQVATRRAVSQISLLYELFDSLYVPEYPLSFHIVSRRLFTSFPDVLPDFIVIIDGFICS